MSVQQIGSPGEIRFRFGSFELNVAQRSLKKANQVIPLGGRAYDILIFLLENAGEVVAKAELIAKAWPDVTVEEGSLRVHLSALRKALGDAPRSMTGVAHLGNCPACRPHSAAWSVARMLSARFKVGSRRINV
jgi:DNA-binding response OmpR family regulator